MKRLLSMLMALAMLLCSVAMAATADCTGTWVLTGVEVDGIQFGPNGLAYLEISMELILNADGTMEIDSSVGYQSGTWRSSVTGIFINLGDGENQLTYADGVLSMAMNGGLYMFTREGAAPAIDDTPKPVTILSGVQPSAFEGTWLMTEMSVYGVTASPLDFGLELTLVLSGGQCVLTMRYDGDTDEDTLTYTVTEVPGVGTVLTIVGAGKYISGGAADSQLNLLADGRLYMKEDGNEYIFTRQGGSIRIAGDANVDGQVDVADVTVTAQHAAGEQIAISLANADVNADGRVDVRDVLLMMQFAAGWDVSLQ